MKENPVYRDLHETGLPDVKCMFLLPRQSTRKESLTCFFLFFFVFFVYWVNNCVFLFFKVDISPPDNLQLDKG